MSVSLALAQRKLSFFVYIWKVVKKLSSVFFYPYQNIRRIFIFADFQVYISSVKRNNIIVPRMLRRLIFILGALGNGIKIWRSTHFICVYFRLIRWKVFAFFGIWKLSSAFCKNFNMFSVYAESFRENTADNVLNPRKPIFFRNVFKNIRFYINGSVIVCIGNNANALLYLRNFLLRKRVFFSLR